MAERVYLYDSMLRDGVQTQGIDVTVRDKQDVVRELDELLGIDYIEGGWPGANPTDDAFFADLPKTKRSKITAFGMTRRINTSAENDPGLNALLNTGVEAICIVGKSWDFHVTDALGITLDENITVVRETVEYLAKKGVEVIFDAEHFFDGYKNNPEFTLSVAKAAYEAGARWVVLCDTNGGTLPHEVDEIVRAVTPHVPGDHLGIHCHNDTENAVANSLAAVRAGVRQVQGTINGWGERCGNANLISLIPTLKLKMGFDVGVSDEQLQQLTKIANRLDDRLNVQRYKHAAYVGSSAFAHKGGLHVSAVNKNPTAYEHIEPELVGNERKILVSDQAGRSNIISKMKRLGLDVGDEKGEHITQIVDEIKARENEGYAYDSADASFVLLVKEQMGQLTMPFQVLNYRVLDERRWNAAGKMVTFSEAKIRMAIDNAEYLEIAEGSGPVNALNQAMKKALIPAFPLLDTVKLYDYKVRIIHPELATNAITRVQIESGDTDGNRWTTFGVSDNILNASLSALTESFTYKLTQV